MRATASCWTTTWQSTCQRCVAVKRCRKSGAYRIWSSHVTIVTSALRTLLPKVSCNRESQMCLFQVASNKAAAAKMIEDPGFIEANLKHTVNGCANAACATGVQRLIDTLNRAWHMRKHKQAASPHLPTSANAYLCTLHPGTFTATCPALSCPKGGPVASTLWPWVAQATCTHRTLRRVLCTLTASGARA